MRLAWMLTGLLGCQVALGQDPTVPSSTILNRLKGDSIASIANNSERLPQLSIKAIVMVDGDHGTAIIQADERRIRIRLDRQLANLSKQQLISTPEFVAPSTERLNFEEGDMSIQKTRTVEALQLNATTFYVVDFSNHSILFSDGRRELVVQ